MQKTFIIAGSIIGLLAVVLGAFGAHSFEASLQASGRLATYETAARYQMYAALALVLVGILADKFQASKWINYAGWCFVIGSIVFSGSLYLICLTGIKTWGAVAPIGGLLLMLGWLNICLAAINHKSN